MIRLTNRDYMKLIGYFPCDNHDVRKIAKAQVKKMVDLLKKHTIPAHGGNRIILDEDWQALLNEVEDGS